MERLRQRLHALEGKDYPAYCLVLARTAASAASTSRSASGHGSSGLVMRRSTTPCSDAQSSVARGSAATFRDAGRHALTASTH